MGAERLRCLFCGAWEEEVALDPAFALALCRDCSRKAVDSVRAPGSFEAWHALLVRAPRLPGAHFPRKGERSLPPSEGLEIDRRTSPDRNCLFCDARVGSRPFVVGPGAALCSTCVAPTT